MQVFAAKLKEFWITGDPRRRGRCLAFTSCLMAAYGLMFSTVGGEPRNDAAHQALIVGALVMALSPFVGKWSTSPRSPFSLGRGIVIIIAGTVGIFPDRTSLLLPSASAHDTIT